MGLTIAEKILSRKSLENKEVKAGDYVGARIDGLMIHMRAADVNAKAIEAGLPGGLPRIWDPERVFMMTDHHQPPQNELQARNNKIARDMADRLGIKYFHDAEPGVCHQMMLDYGYVRPGELIVGPDSHCTLYGALNAAGAGIAEPDAAYVAVFGELWLRVPDSVKIVITGPVPTSYPVGKDLILYLAGQYGDDFARYMAIEYTGSAVQAMDMSNRMCLADHAVEVGAKFGFFEADEKTLAYVAEHTDRPFEAVSADPDAQYSKEIMVNMENVGVRVAKPHTFGNVVPIEEVAGKRIDQAMIGSCANGRLEDIEVAARILRGQKVAKKVRFLISPASYPVYLQCLEAGLVDTLIRAGAQFLMPGCGVCSPRLGYLADGEVAITATTRNYRGRKGSPKAEIYLGGPATVAASAITGVITDPREVLHAESQ
ncbi:MAG: aconitase/3-isopropylmalate dehydratase large subunit family protein [Candidatus Binatia bacterium]